MPERESVSGCVCITLMSSCVRGGLLNVFSRIHREQLVTSMPIIPKKKGIIELEFK